MKHCLIAIAFLGLGAGVVWAQEPSPVASRLEAFAVLPSGETAPPPRDAPSYFSRAGRFAGPGAVRNETEGAVTDAGGAPALPMAGQPLQGISAVLNAGDGEVWGLSDNGFGSRANSADALLMIHRFRIDWAQGEVRRLRTIFLSDPNRVAPFPIVSETHARRYLTGRDFDPESIAPRVGGGFWIGDEFGPYLLEFDAQGRLLSMTPVVSGAAVVRSPDHWQGADGATIARSRGLEGMAHADGGRMLYPMLEGPIGNASGARETLEDGRPVVRILEFDAGVRAFTGREWLYPLADPSHAIGDLTLLGGGHALVIERDGAEGAQARHKRIIRVRLPDQGGLVEAEAVLDLLAVPDPDNRSRGRAEEGVFRFPFVTIESVAVLEDGSLLVVNDNNYPFSAGRNPGAPDDTEWIRVFAPALTQTGPP